MRGYTQFSFSIPIAKRTVPTNIGSFARFMTMQEKQILARAIGMGKKLGVATYFSEIIKPQ